MRTGRALAAVVEAKAVEARVLIGVRRGAACRGAPRVSGR